MPGYYGLSKGQGQRRPCWWADSAGAMCGRGGLVVRNYEDKAGLAYYWLEANGGRVLLVVLFAVLGLWGLLLEGREDLNIGQRLVRGMGPELAGIVIAAVTIDALNEKRQRDNRKAQLIRQLGSRYRDVTEVALLELKHEGWLYDGTLRGVDLTGADLSGADLHGVALNNAQLPSVNLAKANLQRTNLSDTGLPGAILSGADLMGAILDRASLRGASLVEARLWRASFVQASIRRADLKSAFLWEAKLDASDMRDTKLTKTRYWSLEQFSRVGSLEGATMPDGIRLGRAADDAVKKIDGPTFDEWKAQYLATHGGTEADLRDTAPLQHEGE